MGNAALDPWFPNTGADLLHKPHLLTLFPFRSKHTHLLAILWPCKVSFHPRAFALDNPSSQNVLPYLLSLPLGQAMVSPPLVIQHKTAPHSHLALPMFHDLLYFSPQHTAPSDSLCMCSLFIDYFPLLKGKLCEDKVLSFGVTARFPESRTWGGLIHVFK